MSQALTTVQPHSQVTGAIESPTRGPKLGLWAAGVSLALSVWAGVEIGSLHPDEVFQFLEPANHLAFGYGWMSWEWTAGIRNWAVPGAFAGAMKLIHSLGWTTPWGHRFAVSLVVGLMAYPGVAGILRYSARRFESAEPRHYALFALMVVVGWGPCFLFLGRTMGESMGALFGMAAIEALDRPERRRTDMLLAGVWLGLAVVVRYTFAVLVIALILQLVFEKRWANLLTMCLGGLPIALALGALDWATWGDPFHSMFAYVGFNAGEKAAKKFGREPWWFFIRVAGWLPWVLLVGLPWTRPRRARALFPAALYLLALTVTPHKEGRFLFPVILWTAVDLAPGFVSGIGELLAGGASGRRLAKLAVAAFIFSGAGSYAFMVDLDADLFRGTIEVGEDPKTTGVLLAGHAGRWGSGGNFYLGRPLDVLFGVPGEEEFEGALKNSAINRVVAEHDLDLTELQDAGFKVIDRVGFTRVVILGR